MNGISVKTDFYAAGDGKVDDYAAIQAALDACAERGGTVFFPSGVYRIDECLLYSSDQRLLFENGAVLLRGRKGLRYLLANRTHSRQGGYTATHNVDIIGATFDGNAAIDEKATLLNNSHSRDLRIKNCKFLNGNTWHYYECNSSEYVTVENCVFFDSMKGTELSEYIQLDWAMKSAYGTTDICEDKTVCRHILITGCKFECDGFSPAIGNHTPAPHNHIRICGNLFLNGAGPRGYVNFVKTMFAVDVYDNTFSGGDAGVFVGGNGGGSVVRDNRFENVITPYGDNLTACNNHIEISGA